MTTLHLLIVEDSADDTEDSVGDSEEIDGAR